MEIMQLLSVLILLSCFVLVANKRTKSYIRTFQAQSALLAIAAFMLGMDNLSGHGAIEIMFVCLLIVTLKVYYIPKLLGRTFANVDYKVEKNFFYNIPLLVLVSCAIAVFNYFSISSAIGGKPTELGMYLANSVSVIFIGFFFMISRKKAIGQIVGLLVMENGIFAAALFTSGGMPVLVDVGIFIDLITAVIIMGIMVFKINEELETTDINKLKRLRG